MPRRSRRNAVRRFMESPQGQSLMAAVRAKHAEAIARGRNDDEPTGFNEGKGPGAAGLAQPRMRDDGADNRLQRIG